MRSKVFYYKILHNCSRARKGHKGPRGLGWVRYQVSLGKVKFDKNPETMTP